MSLKKKPHTHKKTHTQKKQAVYGVFFLFSARQPSSGVNYVKLWVSDGKEGQGYALTLVASDMSKLMVRKQADANMHAIASQSLLWKQSLYKWKIILMLKRSCFTIIQVENQADGEA